MFPSCAYWYYWVFGERAWKPVKVSPHHRAEVDSLCFFVFAAERKGEYGERRFNVDPHHTDWALKASGRRGSGQKQRYPSSLMTWGTTRERWGGDQRWGVRDQAWNRLSGKPSYIQRCPLEAILTRPCSRFPKGFNPLPKASGIKGARQHGCLTGANMASEDCSEDAAAPGRGGTGNQRHRSSNAKKHGAGGRKEHRPPGGSRRSFGSADRCVKQKCFLIWWIKVLRDLH